MQRVMEVRNFRASDCISYSAFFLPSLANSALSTHEVQIHNRNINENYWGHEIINSRFKRESCDFEVPEPFCHCQIEIEEAEPQNYDTESFGSIQPGTDIPFHLSKKKGLLKNTWNPMKIFVVSGHQKYG